MTYAGAIYRHMISKFPPPKEGDLCVWWIPQVPSKPFEWRIANLEQASLLLDALAAYDDFQFAENIKPDYCNAGGLWRWHNGEWEEWENEDGDGIDAVRFAEAERAPA